MVEEAGGKAIAISSDISREADAKAISDAAMKAFGTIDIVVNKRRRVYR